MSREVDRRPLLFALAGLAIGLGAHFSPWTALLLIPVLAVVWKGQSRWFSIVAFLIGLILNPSAEPAPIEDEWFDGVAGVITVPTATESGMRAVVRHGKTRYRVYFKPETDVALGDVLRLKAYVRPLSEAAVRERGASGVLLPLRVTLARKGAPWWRWGMAWSSGFASWVDANMNPREAAYAKALCFNRTEDLEPEDWSILRSSGAMHIVSTSGLHVMIAAGAAAATLILLPIPRPAQLALLFGLLLLYAAAAGFRPPMVRAVVMAMIAWGAYIFNREGDGVSAVSAAAIAYLIWMPESIADLSLQLSFLAMFALVLYLGPQPSIEEGNPWGKLMFWASTIAKTSLIATAAVTPLLLQRIGEVSVIGLLTNLLILPILVPLIIVGANLLWLLSLPLPDAAAALLQTLIETPTTWMISIVDALGSLPFASVSSPWFSAWWLALIYGAMLYIWRPKHRQA